MRIDFNTMYTSLFSVRRFLRGQPEYTVQSNGIQTHTWTEIQLNFDSHSRRVRNKVDNNWRYGIAAIEKRVRCIHTQDRKNPIVQQFRNDRVC